MKTVQLNCQIPESLHRKLKASLVNKGLSLKDWLVKAVKKEVGEK